MKRFFNYCVVAETDHAGHKEGDIIEIYGSKVKAEQGLIHYGVLQENWIVLSWEEVLNKKGYLIEPYRFKFKLYQ